MNHGVLRLLFVAIFLFISYSSNAKPVEGQIVELQILDKITTKVKSVEIGINENLKLGSLLIEIYACYKRPPEEIPEDFVLLKIFDELSEDFTLIYQGWMISSSPAATPLEHPIYDIWIKNCKIDMSF